MAIDPRIDAIEKERRRKSENKKREAHGMEPQPPARLDASSFFTPAMFPEDAPPILRRNRLTKRQFSRFGEQLSMFAAANLSADAIIMLQTLIRLGDMEALKVFFRIVGLDKNVPQTVVNLQQNNTLNNQVSSGERTFDTLVRQLDDRDRKAIAAPAVEAEIIDAEPSEPLEA